MKTIFIVLLFNSFIYLHSQTKEELKLAFKKGDIKTSKNLIDKLLLEDSNKNDPELWFYKGKIYLNIYSTSNKDASNQAWDALEQAYKAFTKVLELDKNHAYTLNTIEFLKTIAQQFSYEGVYLFNKRMYRKALEFFENGININQLPAIRRLDTLLYYNAALAAEKVEDYQKACDYYEKLKQWKFQLYNILLELGKLYVKMDNSEKALETFKQGISLFSNNPYYFYTEIINLYLMKNQYDKCLEYLDKAISIYRDTASLYFIKGSIMNALNKNNEAEQLYKKCVEKDPYYKDALFNLGAIYFNRATEKYRKAKTKSEQNEALMLYQEAEKYLIRYIEKDTTDEVVLKMLKTIYTLKNEPDKLDKINDLLNKLN
ncbi:MAG: hypothetical protein N3A01_04855 [Bacteroidales bacterium]|nr:hypothetical protein [Bacteroidales bacterium]